jgi:hypothetical protein
MPFNKEKSLENTTALYEAILSHAGYAIIATDLNGIITLTVRSN